MFCAIIVLPKPLRPTRTRLRVSPRKSSVNARSIMSRSIFVGQDQSKSAMGLDRKSTRLNSSHLGISYAVFCLKKKKKKKCKHKLCQTTMPAYTAVHQNTYV